VPVNRPNRADESPIANSRFMPLANRPQNLFIKKTKTKKTKREKKKLAGFWPDSGQISPEFGGVSSESLLIRVSE
jgi:hypothetical protein